MAQTVTGWRRQDLTCLNDQGWVWWMQQRLVEKMTGLPRGLASNWLNLETTAETIGFNADACDYTILEMH